MRPPDARFVRSAAIASAVIGALVLAAPADPLHRFLKKAAKSTAAQKSGAEKSGTKSGTKSRTKSGTKQAGEAEAGGGEIQTLTPNVAGGERPGTASPAIYAPAGSNDEPSPPGYGITPRILPPAPAAPAPPARGKKSSRPASPAAAGREIIPAVVARPLAPGERPGDQRAILTMIVNLVDKGEVFVVLRSLDVLVQGSDLEGAGIHNPPGQRETIDGKNYVSMKSLAGSGIGFELDERALTLRVTAPTADLGSTVIDLGTKRPPGILDGDGKSAFVNYALRMRNLHFDAFFEAGAAWKDAFLYTQASINPDGRAVRGLTSLSYAERGALRRWILGDTFAASGLLGGGLFLGGASVVRDFNLDPYFYRFPSTGLSGAVTTPSTVDVYVNGTLVHREEISPGSFQVNNLPLPVGAGSAQIVVRDAFGHEQTLATPFYFSTGILKPGLADYGFHAGFRRNNLATSSFDYAPPVFLGRYRFGLSDRLTVGGRAEGSDEMASAGSTATFRTPFGELEGAAAASYDHGGGAAASLAYTYLGRSASFGALGRGFSGRYTNLSLDTTRDRPTVEASAYAGASIGSRLSVTGRVGVAHYRDAGNWQQVGLLSSIRVHDGVSLFVTADRTAADNLTHASYDVFASVSVALPERVTASAFAQATDGHGAAGAEVQRPLPLGEGYGYRVRAMTGPVQDVSATALGQTNFGRYEASYERIGHDDITTVSAAGGVVAVGGEVFATRPVQQGFGLLRVPGARGVRGYLNNQEVGRTDDNGNLLVPELIPYYGNRLSIADDDLPLDWRVGETEQLLAPPLRGGGVATFDAHPIRIVTGSVALEFGGQMANPSFGQMTVRVGMTEMTSPLGKLGEFYFEELRPGHFTAEVDSAIGACRLQLEVPPGDKPFVDVGVIKCAATAPLPPAPPPATRTPILPGASPLPPGTPVPLPPATRPLPGAKPGSGTTPDGEPIEATAKTHPVKAKKSKRRSSQ